MKRLALASLSLLIFSIGALAADVPVTAAPPGVAIEPPQYSYGVKYCHDIVIWVVLKDGHVIRVDKEHHPKTPEDMQKFLAWLDTGPSDVQTIACTVST